MYAPQEDSPSLWDMGTGKPYVEERSIPAGRPHIQMTCRSCGAARWYLHRVTPLSLNPLPVFSVMSPMWDEGCISYERVPQPPSRLTQTRLAPAALEKETIIENRTIDRLEQGKDREKLADPMRTLEPDTRGNPHADKNNQVPMIQPQAQEQPINSLSAMLEPFAYDTSAKPLISPSIMNFDNFENSNDQLLSLSPPIEMPEIARIQPINKRDATKMEGVNDPQVKNMNGHKHLKGSTTWCPLSKRGRTGSNKSVSHSSTHSKKPDKRPRDTKPKTPSSSLGQAPRKQ